MDARQAAVQEEFNKRSDAAVLKVKIKAVCFASSKSAEVTDTQDHQAERILLERLKIIVWYMKGHYPSQLYEADQKDLNDLRVWEAELAKLEKVEAEL
jgi:hypothetical protein